MLNRTIDWFTLREGIHEPLPADKRAVIHSRVFPGLRPAVWTLLTGDLAAVLAEQQAACGTPEHQACVAGVAARPARAP